MKKIIMMFTIIILLITTANIAFNLDFYTRQSYEYDAQKAVEYSYQYIKQRDPQYANFEQNCINYISQCLIAGGVEMDQEKPGSIRQTKLVSTTKRWFSYSYDNDPNKPLCYYVSSSFFRLQDFVKYWTKTAKVPYTTIQNTKENVHKLKDNGKVGDILIFKENEKEYTHAAIIVKIEEDDIYYNSNTNNRNEYPLSLVSDEEYPMIVYLNFVK